LWGKLAVVPRDFADVQKELQEAARRLEASEDPKARREILKEMGALLKEADRINASTP
jgi:hypothetical protein